MKHKIFEDNLIRKIIRNSGIVFAGNSMASALSIVSFTIMANNLGPRFLALLVLAQTYALILNDIFNIQTWESMIKFGPQDSEHRSIANVIKTNFVLDFTSAVVAFIFALLLARPVVHILGWDESLINIVSLYSISILFNITTLTIGIPRLFNKFASIAKIQVAMALIKLLSVLYVMYFSKTFIYYVYIYLSVDILTNVLLLIYSILLLKQKLGKNWWKNKMSIDINQIKFIWWTNLRTIIRIPVRHFDMIVISSIMSIELVGIYKVYKEMAGFINRIGEPINQVIFPEFTKLISKDDINSTISTTKKTIFLLGCLGAVITVVLLLASKTIIAVFFGAEYLSQINALYALLVLFGISFVLVPINSLFIAAGFVKSSFHIVIFTNTMYLLTAFYFGKLFGIYGVVTAYAVQMVLNQGLKLFLLRKYSSGWSNTLR